jgi:hypothetical protein
MPLSSFSLSFASRFLSRNSRHLFSSLSFALFILAKFILATTKQASMRSMSLPGVQARSTCSSTQVQRCCLPTAAPHLRPLQIRQRLAAQPRNLYSNAPLRMQHQPFPLGLACSASSGENGSDGSEKGRGGNGNADGSSPTSLRISTSSNPLPVPEPMPPSTRIEADLGDGEFDAFKEVSRE